MPAGKFATYTIPYPISFVRTPAAALVAMHKLATVTGTAAELSTFISGGLPSWWEGTNLRYPTAVQMWVQSGESGSVFVTLDGTSTPLANGLCGMLVPQAPSFLMVTAPDLAAGIIKAVSTGSIAMQCFFMP